MRAFRRGYKEDDVEEYITYTNTVPSDSHAMIVKWETLTIEESLDNWQL